MISIPLIYTLVLFKSILYTFPICSLYCIFSLTLLKDEHAKIFVLCEGEPYTYIYAVFLVFCSFSNLLKILFSFYTTILATFAIPGHLSQASFAIGPLNMVPFGVLLSSFKIITALSSNLILIPSALLYSFFCLTITANTTFFLISGLPLLTEAMTKSPTPPADLLPFVPLKPTIVNILINLAPELSHVSISE